MKPTIEGLTAQFTALIGPEPFAKAEAAIAAAKAAAAAAAKAAAEKAAAAPAAAKAGPTSVATAGTPLSAGASNVGAVPPPRIAAAMPRVEGTPPTSGTAAPPAPRPVAPAAPAAPRVAPAPVLPSAPLPSLPVQATPHAAKGYDLDALVASHQIVQAAELVDRAGFALDTITGVDWIAQNEMEVVYDFFHPTESLHVVIRTRVPRATPELPSITAVFSGANWHERETHDFFGIRFVGHPNLKPFLLPEDANFHPLRKDYQP